MAAEQKPDDAVRSHWLAAALDGMLTDRQPDASPITLEVDPGDQRIVIETRDGQIYSRLGVAEHPDVTITGPARPIMGLLLGLVELADAEASGVTYQGDPAILDRIGASLTPGAAPS
jgi:hypothetical protein